MPSNLPHTRCEPPHAAASACTLARIRATHASLAEDRRRIEASLAALGRSRALLADREVRPGGLDAVSPVPRSPALPPSRDATGAPDADDLQRRMIDGLQLILALIERRLRRAEGTEAREALSALLGDVSALGAVQRRFCDGDPDGLADGLADLGAGWRRLAAGRGIEVEVQAEPVEVGEQQAAALVLAANELVLNSLKHAFADGEAGRVSVALRGGGGGWGELRVADDGRGLVDGMGPSSLGLELIAGLVRRVGGELRLSGAGATRASVRFPLAGHIGPDGGTPEGVGDGAPRPPRPA